MLSDIKAGTAGVICLVLGLLGGGVTVSLYDAFIAIPAAERVARQAGSEAEKSVWTKLQQDARKLAEDKEREAQGKIQQIARDYHERDQARRSDMAELEEALEQERLAQQEESNATPTPTPSPSAPCSCRPALSRSLRDSLDKIGR